MHGSATASIQHEEDQGEEKKSILALASYEAYTRLN